MTVNYPLLKTFTVDSSITNFLNKKFDQYCESNILFPAENEVYMSDTGKFTQNLLLWDDEEYQEFVKTILNDVISNTLSLNSKNFYIHFIHIFDYNKGGYVKEHKHDHAEDYVFIFYLNNCNTGKTIFFLNNFSEFDKKRTSIEINPIKNNGVCFSSMLMHKAEYTDNPKRIFVVGIKIQT